MNGEDLEMGPHQDQATSVEQLRARVAEALQTPVGAVQLTLGDYLIQDRDSLGPLHNVNGANVVATVDVDAARVQQIANEREARQAARTPHSSVSYMLLWFLYRQP